MTTTICRLLRSAALAVAIAPFAHGDFVVTDFGPSTWPRTDAAIGVAGFTIEDFENTALAAGLRIGTTGNPTSSTLPNTFHPVNDDPFLDVFAPGVWDGSHLLINQANNQLPACGYNCGGWVDFLLEFQGGASSVGFSLEQLDLGITLYVNGSSLAVPYVPVNLTGGGNRNGYLRLDATGGDVINSLRLDFAGPDGVAIDHLAFAPTTAAVPEPGTIGFVIGGLLVLFRRHRRGKSFSQKP
jgi:hypothetical protein